MGVTKILFGHFSWRDIFDFANVPFIGFIELHEYSSVGTTAKLSYVLIQAGLQYRVNRAESQRVHVRSLVTQRKECFDNASVTMSVMIDANWKPCLVIKYLPSTMHMARDRLPNCLLIRLLSWFMTRTRRYYVIAEHRINSNQKWITLGQWPYCYQWKRGLCLLDVTTVRKILFLISTCFRERHFCENDSISFECIP